MLFFVYAPYQTDERILIRRAEARTPHLAGLTKLREDGVLRFGGVLSDPEDTSLAVGSTMVFEQDSVAEVKTILEADAYYSTNVWDRNKLVIRAYSPGVPLS